jgi:hypothetical protein
MVLVDVVAVDLSAFEHSGVAERLQPWLELRGLWNFRGWIVDAFATLNTQPTADNKYLDVT